MLQYVYYQFSLVQELVNLTSTCTYHMNTNDKLRAIRSNKRWAREPGLVYKKPVVTEASKALTADINAFYKAKKLSPRPPKNTL